MSEFELSAANDAVRRAAIIDDPADAEARLRMLHPDLSLSLFRNAVMGGLSARNEVTRASAPTAAGVQQWLNTVEGLRTLLAAAQWHIHEQQNCPFISSPDRVTSIVVMTGNGETGKKGFEDPTNQAEKGAVAESFVQKNHQLELFNRDSFKLAKDNQKETQVWALLYHYDKGLNEVRYELSLPTGFSKKKITQWGERILLGSIPNNPTDFAIFKEEPNTPASVEVEPKIGAF
ncbi:hypothetical protein [Pseudomonas nitroreducens]|uniref:hypothetical protein n=1 Tax=Pseudomonas nitroreducens TaxID=46680 RepID=UPI002657B66A|nr:hypothetical protein [Pseudomonas nitroreducens]MCP1649437.1 hypothetical protein [Pseudomonas nitroreducens]MCP1684602.1 hypothetical protein [Pseudomonas nitroreducens]